MGYSSNKYQTYGNEQTESNAYVNKERQCLSASNRDLANDLKSVRLKLNKITQRCVQLSRKTSHTNTLNNELHI